MIAFSSLLKFWTGNLQEESDSERERNDVPGSRQPMKRKCGKIQLSISNDSVQSQSIASKDGCLSLLKKRQFDGELPFIVPLPSFS